MLTRHILNKVYKSFLSNNSAVNNKLIHFQFATADAPLDSK